MKKAILLTSFLLLINGFVVGAQSEENPYTVTVDDLTEVGMEEVRPIEPEDERFIAPVRYFRVTPPTEPLSGRDCDDCGDLAAVYVNESATAPIWAESGTNPVRKIGKRIQVRHYEASKKLVIIVTGPDGEKMLALSDLLANKF